MGRDNTRLIIFEINNEQEDYAICLEFLELLYKWNGNFDRKEDLQVLLDKIGIRTADIKNQGIPARHIEEAYSNVDGSSFIKNEHAFSVYDLNNLKVDESSLRFHMRIKLAYSEEKQGLVLEKIMNLQYLALFLKRMEEQFFTRIQKRPLTVFLIPYTGSKYPYKDEQGHIENDTYEISSQYLRLVSNNFTGAIFSAIEDGSNVAIKALDFSKISKFDTYFPLLLIGEKEVNKKNDGKKENDRNNYKKLFQDLITEQDYNELISLGKRNRFRKANAEDPKEAMCDFVIETAWKRLQSLYNDTEIILELYKDNGDSTIMQFALFAYLFGFSSDIKEDIYINIKKTFWISYEICQGLKQIVQNSIQHSPLKTAFFSFYLHQSDAGLGREEFCAKIRENYPETDIVHTWVNKRYEALEVLISDLNEKTNMIENFVQNIQREVDSVGQDLEGHKLLINNKEKLAIRNFFSEYNETDIIKEWSAFRKQDLVAHIGLSLFAITAQQCKASIKVYSSKNINLDTNKGFFYKAYSVEQRLAENADQRYVIPGTQVALLLPIHEWDSLPNKQSLQSRAPSRIEENYKSYAKYLSYEESDLETIDIKSIPPMTDEILSAEKKLSLVMEWQNIWSMRMNELVQEIVDDDVNDNIYIVDFQSDDEIENIRNSDFVEVCIKGLIVALNILEINDDKNIYVAITNLPNGFITAFCKIAATVCLREFPSRLQMFLSERNGDNTIFLMGTDYAQIIENAYILSLEQSRNTLSKREFVQARNLKEKLVSETNEKRTDRVFSVFPFDAVLTTEIDGEKITYFERQIKKLANKSLDSDEIGYKLENTHMRLGSKVHIESFYEMSFFFYRTDVANKIAYILLRHLRENKSIDLENAPIIFHGYASYSKAILNSITEILREYRVLTVGETKTNWVVFGTYQHYMQLELTETRTSYNFPINFTPEEVGPNKYRFKEKVYVIQIVPISSTLTTFDKMWNEILNTFENAKQIVLGGNYTFFWVADIKGFRDGDKLKPSDLEENYWESVEAGRKINMNFPALASAGCGTAHFFIRETAVWQNPLSCDLCYPQNVLEEVPLIETDSTSTVPSQQIRGHSSNSQKAKMDRKFLKQNNKRILELKDCILYGHIGRRQNHYQYYVDTQKYFYKVKEGVKSWLESLNEQHEFQYNEYNEPQLHIIFSPEHSTNVGFAQYVNTFYFNGLAEMISLNVDKEFRSNFICEHAALVSLIKKLQYDSDSDSLPVRFYFVDDTIITGETFTKANNLLRSLLPSNISEDQYRNLFSKVFVLMDRLSEDSKKAYVKNIDENFLSYVHFDISNMRTKADSCIGCKMEKEARLMFKRSATRNLASHWAIKLNNYQVVPYDKYENENILKNDQAFRRLIISHTLQNLIVKQNVESLEGSIYDTLIDLFEWFMDQRLVENKNIHDYKDLLDDKWRIDGIKELLKVVCRPFFSYDFKVRFEVLTFFIALSESLLGIKVYNEDLDYVSERKIFLTKKRLKRTEDIAHALMSELHNDAKEILLFLQQYLLEGLSDMRSTYLLRKQTIQKIYSYVNENWENIKEVEARFWNDYILDTFRLLSNNSDSSKELGMHYLLNYGEEYRDLKKKNSIIESEPQFLFEVITGRKQPDKKTKAFYLFCQDIFLQNTGINFDVLEKVANAEKQKKTNKIDDYYMDYWKQLQSIERPKITLNDSDDFVRKVPNEFKLFTFLEKERKIDENQSVKDWYKKLLINIRSLLHEKYGCSEACIHIALLTETNDIDNILNDIQKLDIVCDGFEDKKTKEEKEIKEKAERYYKIKSKVLHAMQDNSIYDLANGGYYIAENYVVLLFDNPKTEISNNAGRSLKQISQVLLYISINADNDAKKLPMLRILKDVMTYRNRILRYLEQDFGGDIFSRYTHTLDEKNILLHEKAQSHATTADDKISIEKFTVDENRFEKFYADQWLKDNVFEWLVLRNYTNGQIAKIFNRSFTVKDSREGTRTLPYYVKESQREGDIYKQKLEAFYQLGIYEYSNGNIREDGRFKLIKEVFEIIIDKDLVQREFITNYNNEGYNIEYFRCIIIDIILSAIKYHVEENDFLLRIDYLLQEKKQAHGKEVMESKMHTEVPAKIEFLAEENLEDEKVDYLLIRNPIGMSYAKLRKECNWSRENQIISHRLDDPLDYADGHMSLLAIKRYIEQLVPNVEAKCLFHYIPGKDIGKKEDLYFEIKLPVLKKKKESNL